MENSELINLCIKREPSAWVVFVNRFSPLVYWAIEQRLKKWDYLYQKEDIEEIHQEVFTSLWDKNKLQQIKDHQRIEPWIIMVAGNMAIDYFRYKKGQLPPKTVPLYDETFDTKKPTHNYLSTYKTDPAKEAISSEINKILDECLSKLSAVENIIVRLSLLYGKTYKEIAKILNLPIGTVACNIKRAKSRLKELLKSKGIDF